MTEGVDRTALVQLLEKLGSEKDEDVLQAAREAQGLVTAAGTNWDDLIAAEKPVASSTEGKDSSAEEAPADGADLAPPDDAEALALIEKLMALPELSDSMRQELEGYREDIAEKEFDDMDRKYLRALHQRLVK